MCVREREKIKENLSIFSPLGVEAVGVVDTQLGLTFSPQQIGTTIPSSE